MLELFLKLSPVSVHQIKFSQFRWQKIILFLTSWRRQIPSNSAKLLTNLQSLIPIIHPFDSFLLKTAVLSQTSVSYEQTCQMASMFMNTLLLYIMVRIMQNKTIDMLFSVINRTNRSSNLPNHFLLLGSFSKITLH